MITAGLTNSFKEQLLEGIHDFSVDVIKIALYTSDAELGADTLEYTTVGEVSGTGYTATGLALTNATVQRTGGVAYVSFDNPAWNASTFTTRGALIYNSSKANRSVGVLNFGLDQTMLSQQFQIQFPPNNADSALIRIS
tara:strand:+ start:321 stop:737 length:417 start_codon:yes stop_codon:yes gene_type:complete